MKKKLIQTIPWLTAEEQLEKFTVVAKRMMIKDIEHLFVEVYKDNLQVPTRRFVYNDHEFGCYYPESDTWSECGVAGAYGLQWGDRRETGISEKSIDEIIGFLKAERNKWKRWFDYLEEHRREILYNRRMLTERNKQDAPNARCRLMPALLDLAEWAKKTIFRNGNYLYYKRKGRYADFTCSRCGMKYTRTIMRKDTFEGQFENVVEAPKHMQLSRCECCKASGHYAAEGKMQGVYGITKRVYLGQPYKETGAVVRYIEIEKIMSKGKPENYHIREVARTFFEPGKKIYTDWYYDGSWKYHNTPGLCKMAQGEGYIHPDTYMGLSKTILRYSGLQWFADYFERIEAVKYLKRYLEAPQMEMASKGGLYHLAAGIMNERVSVNKTGKMEEVLDIHREKVSLLREHQGDIMLLKVLRIEKRQQKHWTDEQCEKLSVLVGCVSVSGIERGLRYMSAQQLINRVEKYAGTLIGNSKGAERIRNITITYMDYLSMCGNLGYDMQNSIILHPRNLRQEHQKVTTETNQKERELHIIRAEEAYPKIRENYRRLRNRYYCEDDSFLIRPARSAEEIINEGRTLHHCVGNDTYLKKHNEERSIILMLREKKDPETPYITVEIGDGKILQWYGINDTKPNKNQISKWLEDYIKNLSERLKEAV